jgi:hypothetical protein
VPPAGPSTYRGYCLPVLLLALAACSEAPAGPDSLPDPADQAFVNDVAIVKRHGRVMSWEHQQLDVYFTGLAQRPAASFSCKERALSLVQPAVDNLIGQAASDQRRHYEDQARHQLHLVIDSGNPCDFPLVDLD